MNRKNYYRSIAFVVLLCGLITTAAMELALNGRVLSVTPDRPDVAVNSLLMAISIPLALLAAIQERRREHVSEMRNLWFHIVGAVQKAIQLPYATSLAELPDVKNALSTTIDLARALAPNYGPLYPLEPLKQMYKVIENLPNSMAPKGSCAPQDAVNCILDCWHLIRNAWLSEVGGASLSEPALCTHPDVMAIQVAAVKAGLIAPAVPGLGGGMYVRAVPPATQTKSWFRVMLGV